MYYLNSMKDVAAGTQDLFVLLTCGCSEFDLAYFTILGALSGPVAALFVSVMWQLPFPLRVARGIPPSFMHHWFVLVRHTRRSVKQRTFAPISAKSSKEGAPVSGRLVSYVL